ncbi:MAG: hypothetical protein HOM21_02390 [Halobacteriovoraceae bacterium]|jgi:hypothetical protein|nr:hypothetical protein [Halobacteriovoraceae bacterium]
MVGLIHYNEETILLLKKWLIRSFAVLFLVSCVSQNPPEVQSDRVSQVAGLECNLNILKGLLEHSNVTRLFPCLKWDRKYPQMTRALGLIPAKLWNHVMLPIDRIFLADRKQRDRSISMIKDLDSRGGLDDLSEILKSVFMNANFHDGLLKILVEAETNSPDRLTKQDLKNVMALMNAPPEHFDDFASVLGGFTHASLGKNKDLKRPMQKLIKKNQFQARRLEMLDSLIENFKEAKLDARDRFFFSSLPALRDAKSKLPVLYHWLHMDQFGIRDFKRILNYPIFVYPTMHADLRTVLNALPEVSCKLRGKPGHLTIDLHKDLSRYISAMVDQPFDEFFNLGLDSLYKLNMADASCELGLLIGEDGHKANMYRVFNRGNKFYGLPNVFNLLKIVQYLPFHYDRQNPVGADPFYFLKLLTKESMESSQDFLKVILEEENAPLLDPTFEIIKSLPIGLYFSAAKLVKFYIAPSIFPKIQVMGKFWDQLTVTNKQSITAIIDAHFSEAVDYRLLRRFYQSMVDDLPKVAPLLAKAIVGNEEKRENTFQALKFMALHMGGDEMLQELRQFYSRDGILKVIEIISRTSSPGGPGLPGNDDPTTSPGQTEPTPGVPPIYIAAPTTEQTERQIKLSNCIDRLSREGFGFYGAVQRLPRSCELLTTDNFIHQLFSWGNQVHFDFQLLFPKRSLFSKRGLFGKDMLQHGMSSGLVMEQALSSLDGSTVGINYLLETAKNQLYLLPKKSREGHGYLDLIDKGLEYTASLFQNNTAAIENYKRSLLIELSSKDPEQFKDTVGHLSSVLNDYSFSKIADNSYVESTPCNTITSQLGAPPCPSLEQINFRTKRYLDMLKVNYPGVPTTVDLMVDAVIPSIGIPLPFAHKQKTRHFISPEETLFMFWDAGDPRYDRKVKFQDPNSEKARKVNASLVERLESTIREASFNLNFIGIFFKNSIIKTMKYSKEAKKSHALFKLCLKIRWCGMPMNKENRRMGKNAVDTFESLRTLNDEFPHKYFKTMKYGRWIQTFITTMVGSSHKRAHKSSTLTIKLPWLDPLIIPHFLPKKDRLRHKGLMFTELNYVSAISNLSRLIRDRFSADEKVFSDFIKSYEFRRVNRKLFESFPAAYTKEILNRIIKKHTGGEDQLLYTLVDDLVAYLYHLDYQSIRDVEDTIGNLLVVATYLGNDGTELNDGWDPHFNDPRYGNLGTHRFLDVIELAVNLYPTLKKYWPEDLQLLDVLRPVNRFLKFFKKGLDRGNKKSHKLAYYHTLNQSFLLFDQVFLKQEAVPLMGLELLARQFKKRPEHSIELLRETKDYIDRLHYFKVGQHWNEDRSRFFELSDNLRALSKHRNFTGAPLNKYLLLAGLSEIEDGSGQMIANPAYLEPFNLLSFLADGAQESRLSRLSSTLLIERKDDLLEFLQDTFKLIHFNDEDLIQSGFTGNY